MQDFASAAMLRLVALGLRRQGLAAPVVGAAGAHVPLDAKRSLLEQLLRAYGPACLLRIGEGVQDAREEPTLTALTLARDPLDLVGRWRRLERFVHSRHRIEVSADQPGRIELRHVSRVRGEAPTAAEDLLVFGLLVALAGRLPGTRVRARPAGAGRWLQDGEAWHVPLRGQADVSRWIVAWSSAQEAPPKPFAPARDWTGAAQDRIERDPARAWRLEDLAADMGAAARTLQRRLGGEGASFSAVLLQGRLACAARLLAGSHAPLAEVGYACGFADQAHFTRAFRHGTAMTPARYREQFGTPAADR